MINYGDYYKKNFLSPTYSDQPTKANERQVGRTILVQNNKVRPISLLSVINKLYEKLLCRRIMKFLNANNMSFKFAYGFRKLHSTTLAYIEFTDNARRFLAEGKRVVDLIKAFDTVNHGILVYKLDRYVIRGHSNDFFQIDFNILQIDFNILQIDSNIR